MYGGKYISEKCVWKDSDSGCARGTEWLEDGVGDFSLKLLLCLLNFCLVCINCLFLKNASACAGGEPRELGVRTEARREGTVQLRPDMSG